MGRGGAGRARPTRAAEVARLVRLTETHRPADGDAERSRALRRRPGDPGRPADRYAEYAADVRGSTPTCPTPDFRAGRAAMLRDLLAKPRLFHTAYARERWEATARANLTREVAAMHP